MGDDMSTEQSLGYAEGSAADDLVSDAFQSMVRLAEYHRGNTELLEALMHVHARAVDADDRVASVLAKAGLLDGSGALDWPALEQRRDKPMAWQDAVNRFVKDPTMREELLALDDDPQLAKASDSEGGETS